MKECNQSNVLIGVGEVLEKYPYSCIILVVITAHLVADMCIVVDVRVNVFAHSMLCVCVCIVRSVYYNASWLRTCA